MVSGSGSPRYVQSSCLHLNSSTCFFFLILGTNAPSVLALPVLLFRSLESDHFDQRILEEETIWLSCVYSTLIWNWVRHHDIPLYRLTRRQQCILLTLPRAQTQSFDHFVAWLQERNMNLTGKGHTQRVQLSRVVEIRNQPEKYLSGRESPSVRLL